MSPNDSGAGASLDPGVLDGIRGVGGERLLRELMQIFLERTPERLAAAEAALAESDLAAVARALHSLRSAAGTVGARQLADEAGRLERDARAGVGGGVADRFELLRSRVEEALADSRRLCADEG